MQLQVSASEGYNVTIPVKVLIEPVRDNFESGTFSTLPWTYGEFPWGIELTDVGEGIFSARSGVIADNETSQARRSSRCR